MEQNQPNKQEPQSAKEQAEEFVKIMEAGRKLGLVYRFDAIMMLKKNAQDLKTAGSNGKSKGLLMAADLVTRLPAVDAVKVTRCERCTEYNDGICGKYRVEMKPDDYCSRPSRRIIGGKISQGTAV